MDYLRSIDFESLAAAPAGERITQWLVDQSSAARSCTISFIRTPAGSGSPAGLHTHAVDQLFYIISGTMSIEIAGQTSEAPAGTVVVFPAGVPHRNWNAGKEATTHLAINIPAPDPDVPFATPAA